MSQVILNLDADNAARMNALINSFGSEGLLVDNFYSYYKEKLKREIAQMKTDIKEYESRYQMTSEEFYSRFRKGDVSDSQDFILWSGLIEMLEESEKKLQGLS